MKKIFLLAFVLLAIFNVKAQEGFPDLSFGNNGHVRLGEFVTAFERFESDGKFVAVAGGVRGGFLVARYNADGSLDASFGNGGTVTTIIPNILSSGNGVIVAVQNNGKIVVQVVGGSEPQPSNIVALVRFNSDGSLDATFGSGGIVATFYPPGGIRRLIDDIAIQSDGKIVEVYSGRQGGVRFSAVARYNADGTPDASFQTSSLNFAPFIAAESLIIQNDGKIIIGGDQTDVFPSYTFVERLNSNGGRDASFSRISVTNESFRDMAVHTDGKIVLVTESNKLRRYNADGTPDLSFGNAVIVTSPFDVDKIIVQADGKIITGGNFNALGSNGHFILARYNTNGTFDPNFGYGGMTAIYLAPTPKRLQNMAIVGNRLYAYGTGYLAAFHLSPSPVLTTSTEANLQRKPITEKIKGQKLSALALSNPSTTHFTLQFKSHSPEPVQLRVMDALGRTVDWKRNIAANTTLTIGSGYRAGLYYAGVMQGSKKITIKLVKGSN